MMDGGTTKPANVLNSPSGWSQKTFYDLAKITSGQVDPRKAPYSSMILVAPDHIRTGSGRIDQRLTATQQGAISGKYLVQKGEVIYSKIRPNLQKLALADEDCLCSADMYPVAAKEGVSAHFLKYLMLSAPFTDFATSVSVRSGMPKINRQELAHFTSVVPESFEEQEAIAEALSDADALIEGLERLIAKKRLIKQGAMQDLLTAKRRLPGFSGEWVAKPLSWAISGLKAGVSVNSVPNIDTVDGRPAVLKTSAIFEGRLDLRERKPIADRDIGRARNPLKAGTILISRMNTPALVGECGYVEADEPDVFLPDRIWMTVFYRDRGVCSRWLAAVLSSNAMRSRLKEIATGTSGSMKNIAKGSLLSEVVHFPPSEEQEAIAEMLHDMDAEIQALKTRLEKARQVKEGMMQNLLTGRIRLV